MAEPLRHRQTKEAATDMFSLQPPRHISTLPIATCGPKTVVGRFWGKADSRKSSAPAHYEFALEAARADSCHALKHLPGAGEENVREQDFFLADVTRLRYDSGIIQTCA
jgi:hypothetical protein